MTKERLSKLKGQQKLSKEKTEKVLKNNVLLEQIKWSNIHITGISEGEGERMEQKKIFAEIRADYFPNLMKDGTVRYKIL